MRKILNNYDDDWSDLYSGEIKNIRVRGSYPNVKYKKYIPYKSHHHPGASMFLMNQHKPYGLATWGILDPYDDRPDWYHFHAKHKRRFYEEVMPSDKEAFYQAIEEDREMRTPPVHHVHIQEIRQNNPSEEIEDPVTI